MVLFVYSVVLLLMTINNFQCLPVYTFSSSVHLDSFIIYTVYNNKNYVLSFSDNSNVGYLIPFTNIQSVCNMKTTDSSKYLFTFDIVDWSKNATYKQIRTQVQYLSEQTFLDEACYSISNRFSNNTCLSGSFYKINSESILPLYENALFINFAYQFYPIMYYSSTLNDISVPNWWLNIHSLNSKIVEFEWLFRNSTSLKQLNMDKQYFILRADNQSSDFGMKTIWKLHRASKLCL
jgi:hypothetical protein